MGGYDNTISRFTSMYFAKPTYINTTKIDLISPEPVKHFIETGEVGFSGNTAGKEEDYHFITECFALAHMFISLAVAKHKSEFESLSKRVNEASQSKNLPEFEDALGTYLCLEAHFMSQNLVTGYSNLFQYTCALIMTICSGPLKPNLAALKDSPSIFFQSLQMPCPDEIYFDFCSLPQDIFSNLNEISTLAR